MRVSFTVFNNYAPLKQKLFEANYSAYISRGYLYEVLIWRPHLKENTIFLRLHKKKFPSELDVFHFS